MAEPADGIGAIAARTLARCAELLRAVARESTDWEDAPGVAAQADALLRRAELLATENALAYSRAAALLRGAAPAAHPVRAAETMADAADIPIRIASTAEDIATLASEITKKGASDRRADAAGCAILADAAARTAALLVAVHLTSSADVTRRAAADTAADRAAHARADAIAALDLQP